MALLGGCMSCETPTPVDDSPDLEAILQRWRGRCDDVHVAGYNDEHYDESRSATFYLVFFNGNLNFVKKRYTQFLELYEGVKHRCDELSSGRYRFPNKSIFNTGAKFTKERRKQGFDELLKILVADGGFERELMLFLDLPYQFMNDDEDTTQRSLLELSQDFNEAERPRNGVTPLDYIEPAIAGVESDPWPLFSKGEAQTAAAASLLVYGSSVYLGFVSVGGSTWLRISLTVLLLAYTLLLMQRLIAQSLWN